MKIKITISVLLIIIITLVFFGLKNIQKKKEKISLLENRIIDLKLEKENLPEQLGYLPFYFLNNKKINILETDYFLTKYKTDLLVFTKGLGGIGSSYLDFFDDNLK